MEPGRSLLFKEKNYYDARRRRGRGWILSALRLSAMYGIQSYEKRIQDGNAGEKRKDAESQVGIYRQGKRYGKQNAGQKRVITYFSN